MLGLLATGIKRFVTGDIGFGRSYCGERYSNRSNRLEVGMKKVKIKVGSSGIMMGSALAMIISWSVNHSILWAMLHGVCSWFYVVYYAIVR